MDAHRQVIPRKVWLLGLFQAATLMTVLSAANAEKVKTVPQASCGRQDRTEIVQGQTTLAERFRSGPPAAYNCNLELVGQFPGDGASFSMDAYDRCAYYTAVPDTRITNPGTVVVDVSDSKRPGAATYLNSVGMLNAFESIEVNKARALLLGSSPPARSTPATFDIYDLSGDCRKPQLKSSTTFNGVFSHQGRFTLDGQTYYGAQFPPVPGSTAPPVFAIDTSDASKPRMLATWMPPDPQWGAHSASTSADGSRAYVSFSGDGAYAGLVYATKGPHANGLAILDISEIRDRRPNAQFRLVSTFFWDDASLAHRAVPARIKGRPYLIFPDLGGAIPPSPRPDACDSGKPGHGFARIIDISNEKKPRTVSKLILQVADPVNCSKVMHDPTAIFGYGAFACNVDDADNAALLACGYWEGGLRVFDIRNVSHPVEVAYYKPPAGRKETRPGSMLRTSWGGDWSSRMGPDKDLTADAVVVPSFHSKGREIWFTSTENAFQVVRFTESFTAQHGDLFDK